MNCSCPLPLPVLASYTYAADNGSYYHHKASRPCYWTCPQGYRRSSLNYLTDPLASCQLCRQPHLNGSCPQGRYYAGCASPESEGTSDATCQACTNAPLALTPSAVQYVSAGSQKDLIGVNDCGWMCTVGFFLRFSFVTNLFTCSSCSVSSCPVGQYRETCSTMNRTSNALCVDCTPPAPLYGFLQATIPYNANNCSVSCERGWWFLDSKQKCCSDNAVFYKPTGDCVCGGGFKAPSPELEGIVCVA